MSPWSTVTTASSPVFLATFRRMSCVAASVTSVITTCKHTFGKYTCSVAAIRIPLKPEPAPISRYRMENGHGCCFCAAAFCAGSESLKCALLACTMACTNVSAIYFGQARDPVKRSQLYALDESTSSVKLRPNQVNDRVACMVSLMASGDSCTTRVR